MSQTTVTVSETPLGSSQIRAISRSRPPRCTDEFLGKLTDYMVRRDVHERASTAGESSFALSPVTLQVTTPVPCSSVQSVNKAVAAGRTAQTAWAALSFKERARIALRFHDLLLERQDEVLDLIQWETGKARFHAYQEVAQVAMLARHYARRGRHYLADTHHRGFLAGLTKVREVRVPKGVIGMISPWNYPLYLGVGDALPALLAGNAVVSRADEQTPLTMLWTRALFLEAGLAGDLWQIVLGPGDVIGSALIDSVDFICFTGSTQTGRIVAERAARRLIGASLELGGKNPVIVCEDADLDAAAQGVVLGAFTNSGQMCIHLERAYVHEAVYDAFLTKLTLATRALKIGHAYDYTVEMGSLVSSKQLARVEAHVSDAARKGARVLTGGRHRPDLGPLVYEPTLLEGVHADMNVSSDETFGPVLSLYRVGSDEEAIRKSNDSVFGLSASVWSGDARRADAIARRLHCGAVNINDGAAAAAGSIEAPMGGMRQSGIGRRHGAEGIRKYTDAQTIAAQRMIPLAPPKQMALSAYAGLITKQLKLLRTLGVR